MYKRRRSYGGRRGYGRKKMKALVKRPLRMSVEKKFIDRTLSVLVTTGGVVQSSICIIPEGTNESSRIGRKVTVKSVQVNFQLELFATGDLLLTNDNVRVICYVDHQCNGAAAQPDDILRVPRPDGYRQLQQSTRFQIIYDKWFSLFCPAAVVFTNGSPIVHQYLGRTLVVKFRKKCNIPLEYSGVNGVIGDLRTNNIGILLVSNNDQLTNYTGRSRVRYTDN